MEISASAALPNEVAKAIGNLSASYFNLARLVRAGFVQHSTSILVVESSRRAVAKLTPVSLKLIEKLVLAFVTVTDYFRGWLANAFVTQSCLVALSIGDKEINVYKQQISDYLTILSDYRRAAGTDIRKILGMEDLHVATKAANSAVPDEKGYVSLEADAGTFPVLVKGLAELSLSFLLNLNLAFLPALVSLEQHIDDLDDHGCIAIIWELRWLLDFAVLSYAGAHVSMDERLTSDLPVTKLNQFLATNQTLKHDTIKMVSLPLGCLGPFLGGGNVWAFNCAFNCSPRELAENFYISTDIETFADIWGPVWQVKANVTSEILQYTLNKGTLVPWSSQMEKLVDGDLESRPSTLDSIESDLHAMTLADEHLCHWLPFDLARQCTCSRLPNTSPTDTPPTDTPPTDT
ncbi:MAG: hypothetical protein MMC33_008049 [Icmadophila ericetorum]|nr:hypothetical protein [Icmadophila ericetorum]